MPYPSFSGPPRCRRNACIEGGSPGQMPSCCPACPHLWHQWRPCAGGAWQPPPWDRGSVCGSDGLSTGPKGGGRGGNTSVLRLAQHTLDTWETCALFWPCASMCPCVDLLAEIKRTLAGTKQFLLLFFSASFMPSHITNLGPNGKEVAHGKIKWFIFWQTLLSKVTYNKYIWKDYDNNITLMVHKDTSRTNC